MRESGMFRGVCCITLHGNGMYDGIIRTAFGSKGLIAWKQSVILVSV